MKNLLLKGREAVRNDDAATTFAMSYPVDRAMMDDRHEPGGEARLSSLGLLRYAKKVVVGKIGAHITEHVGDVVFVLQRTPDDGEDQVAISLYEEIPRGVAVAGLQLFPPSFHEVKR